MHGLASYVRIACSPSPKLLFLTPSSLRKGIFESLFWDSYICVTILEAKLLPNISLYSFDVGCYTYSTSLLPQLRWSVGAGDGK